MWWLALIAGCRSDPPAASPAPAVTLQPPTPGPAATPDPTLAEWTVLVYMAADNPLEPAALTALTTWEAAGLPAQVQVVVQLDRADGLATTDDDWREARRYRLSADPAQPTLASEPLALLGEVDSSAPDPLADFIAWGLTHHPARRYALVLWGPGAGWLGLNPDSASPGHTLSLVQLAEALRAGLAAAGLPRFDLLALDASLMGQLEALNAVAFAAPYAVAAPDVWAGPDWITGRLLTALAADPGQAGRDLALATTAGASLPLAAVALDELPPAVTALDQLARQLADDPPLSISLAATARAASRVYAAVAPNAGLFYGAVEARPWLAALAQLAEESSLQTAATTALVALEQAQLAAPAGGLSFYFPQERRAYDPRYTEEGGLLNWDLFLLRAYNQVLPAPTLALLTAPDEVVGLAAPAYLTYEISGRGLLPPAFVAGQALEDGRRRVLVYDLLPPPARSAWGDGVQTGAFTWDGVGIYASDSLSETFVLTWPAGPQRTLSGRYTPAGASTTWPAYLTFDPAGGRPVALWVTQEAALLPIAAQVGDRFQVDEVYVDGAGRLIAEPGLSLDLSQLQLTPRPVSDGDYFVGLTAANRQGELTPAVVGVGVEHPPDALDYRPFVDVAHGLHWLYPADWSRPVVSGTLVYTQSPSQTASLYVETRPQTTAADAAALQAEALAGWSGVSLLYQDSLTLAGVAAARAAYGYADLTGERTGLLVTVVREGQGYIIDLDAPAAAVSQTLATMDVLTTYWTFRSLPLPQPGARWTMQADQLGPAGYQLEQLPEGWRRWSALSNPRQFIAVRADPSQGRSSAALLAEWLALAHAATPDLAQGEAEALGLNGRAWQQRAFRYTDNQGTLVAGLLLARAGAEEQVVWAEAPLEVWPEVYELALLLAASQP